MSNRPRDCQRRRVYEWEWDRARFTPRSTLIGLDECKRLAEIVCADYGFSTPTVTDGRGRRSAGYAFTENCYSAEIRLPRAFRMRWVVLHETAHHLLRRDYEDGLIAFHGPEFVRVYLNLLVEYLGENEAMLSRGLQRVGVRVAPADSASKRVTKQSQ